MTRFLAWAMALILTSAGVTGVILAIVEFVAAYRGFAYLGHGYWWKRAISWKRSAISLTIITSLLVLGVLSIVYLLADPAVAPQ